MYHHKMNRFDALEIVWKMLPVDATAIQKQAWQTVKRSVIVQPTVGISMDAIALAKKHGMLYPSGSAARQQMLDHAQWILAQRPSLE